jgi:triacylglycerol esterase/lipase EstA (alpha/beta hydrolase family)
MMGNHPLLLVHGIDDTGARFKQMSCALRACGFDPVLAMDITPADGSISLEAMGNQVSNTVRTLRQKAQCQKVDIVAYSMGALVARYFIQRQGGRSGVRHFISLAGPHHGTLTAFFRQGIGCRQMRLDSALLQDLNAEADPWGNVEVFSFWSPLDLMIIPAASSLLLRAHNRAFCVPLHPLMVSDKRVIEAVIHALTVSG